ncbi:MAG: hypothetical protein ACOZHQ_04810 [Thermodesulfobacteriota bacterium]
MKVVLNWLPTATILLVLVALDRLHFGVTHFTAFVLILILWSLGLVLVYKALAGKPDSD